MKKEEKSKGSEDIVFDNPDASEKNPRTVKRLKEELKRCVAEKKEYLDGWQRAKADFTNARKQDEKAREEFAKYAKEQFLEELLPVADSFEMAFSNKEAWESVPENWRKGVEHIHKELLAVFERNGLRRIDPLGKPFDPSEHQSVGAVPVTSKNEDAVVKEVVQNGYALNGKVIRAARVKIGEFKK